MKKKTIKTKKCEQWHKMELPTSQIDSIWYNNESSELLLHFVGGTSIKYSPKRTHINNFIDELEWLRRRLHNHADPVHVNVGYVDARIDDLIITLNNEI